MMVTPSADAARADDASSRGSESPRCWCGQTDLLPFSEDYGVCPTCRMLVCRTAGGRSTTDPRVKDESADLYGREYWFSHQTQTYKQPDLHTRARTDLGERCIYWLNAVTRLKLPPARVLELGAAHGGFVFLLRQAGYEAEGSELSPAICEVASGTFGVPMRQGMIEDDAALQPNSLDAIVLHDVLEHLPDPVSTIGRCAALLKDDGLLITQTPCFPEGATLRSLEQSNDRFLVQLKPVEHLFLFSRSGAARLMERVGLRHVRFLPAIYSFYDMYFAASRSEIVDVSDEQRWQHFSRTPELRQVQAMLDAEDRFRGLLAKHRALLSGSGPGSVVSRAA